LIRQCHLKPTTQYLLTLTRFFRPAAYLAALVEEVM
jgi:hypothetical protein